MKFTVYRDVLSKSLRRCDLKGGALGNPALTGTALSARRVPDLPGGLDLRATNGLLGVATMVACNTEVEGDVFVNTKQLATVVNMMPPGTLTLETPEPEVLVVSNGKRRWRGKTMPLANVKPMPEPEGKAVLRLSAEDFLAALGRVGFVVPNVSAEHSFRLGILLDAPGDALSSVVVGEHMIAVSRLQTPCTGKWRGLIPEIALAHARDIATEEEKGHVEIFASANYTWIQNSSTFLMYCPPPGEYLDWRTMLAHVTHEPVCRLPRLAVLETLKAVCVASPDAEPRTWLQVQDDASVAIDHTDREAVITFHDNITVTDLAKGALPSFLINAAYFRDAIDAAGGDPVLNYVDDRHVSLTTEDGFVWTCALIHPDAGERPPSGGVSVSKPPQTAAEAAPAAAPPSEPEKPKRSRRKPAK